MTKPDQAITIVSMVFGVVFGLIALVGGIQVLMMLTLMPPGFLDDALDDTGIVREVRPILHLLLKHFFPLAFTILALFSLTAICAFGVWRRKEWARLGLLVLLVLHIVLVFAVSAMAVNVIQSTGTLRLPGAFGRIPFAREAIARLPSLLFATGYCWFFYTLTRPNIRAEFT